MKQMQPIGTLMKTIISLFTTLLLLQLCPGNVMAHAVVIESSPKDGEVLSKAPSEIILRFNARLEKGLVTVDLTSGDRTSVPLPPIRETGKETQDRLIIPLPPLGPGTYFLRYKILSTDGHATLGRLSFRIMEGH